MQTTISGVRLGALFTAFLLGLGFVASATPHGVEEGKPTRTEEQPPTTQLESGQASSLPPPPVEAHSPTHASPKDLPPRALVICPTCNEELLDEVADQVFAHGGTVSILLPPEAALIRLDPEHIKTLSSLYPTIRILSSMIDLGGLPEGLTPQAMQFVSYWNRSLSSVKSEALTPPSPPPLSLAEGPTGDELRAQIATELLNTHEAIYARAPSAVREATRTVEHFLNALQNRDLVTAQDLIAPGPEGSQTLALLPKLFGEFGSASSQASDFSIRAVTLGHYEIKLQLVDSEGLPTADLVLRPYGLSWKIVEIDP